MWQIENDVFVLAYEYNWKFIGFSCASHLFIKIDFRLSLIECKAADVGFNHNRIVFILSTNES